MKLIIFFLFICSSALAQPSASSWERIQQFRLILKAEDQEQRFNELVREGTLKQSTEEYEEYRVALAINWLAKGNLERYQYYTGSEAKFSFINLLDVSYALEKLVEDPKHLSLVEKVSAEILKKIDTTATLKEDADRIQVLLEVNAMANAKLGNIDLAMKNIERSSTIKGMRDAKYFKDSKSNYLNRYAIVLAAAGQHKKALDVLIEAVRNADSNPGLIATLREVYKKVNRNDKGIDQKIKSLQQEAYTKYYSEVEKSYITDTKLPLEGSIPNPDGSDKKLTILTANKPTASVSLPDVNGKTVNFADYKGKILAIDFWTTGCTPCVAAFAGFEKVVAEYKQDAFQLFIINLFEPRSTVKEFIAKKGISLDVLQDEPNEAYNIQATPTKIVFDPKGNIRFYAAGYAGSTDREYYKLKAMVEITKARASENSTTRLK